MASEPVLEIPPLLEPIPGDNPAGDPVGFDVRQNLDEMRVEINPDDFAADDPTRPTEPKKADWAGIIRGTKEILSRRSKDLLTSCRLLEGLTRHHGCVGLRDGLELVKRLVVECWDRVYPPLDPDDAEVRAGPFNWIDDFERGARFPQSVRQVGLVPGEGREYTWVTWRMSQDGKGDVPRDKFEEAIGKASPERCQAQREDLAQARIHLMELSKALTEKLGSSAPSMLRVRQAVDEVYQLADEIAKRKGPVGGAAEAGAEGGEAGTGGEGGGGGGAPRAAASRAEAYRQLAQAAALLKQIEPHSPIPYLIDRCVNMGSLLFPDMIKQLIRDANVLSELDRELGIKPPEG